MKKKLPNEFLFTVVALLIVTIFVHAAYVLHIRPVAEATLRADREKIAVDPNYVTERSFYVIIKDYEQQAEIILMLWALAIIGYKAVVQQRELRVLRAEVLRLPDGTRILPEDTREYTRQLEGLPAADRETLVPRALMAALARFGATRNVQDASTVAHGICQSEAERLRFWSGRKNAFPASGRISPDYMCMDSTIPRKRLADILIAIGEMDVHYGAIGCGVAEGTLVKVIGTSTCDCAVVSSAKRVPDIPGICGIVPGAILPGFHGIEAGQSAVGDIFKWWVEVVCGGDEETHAALTREAARQRHACRFARPPRSPRAPPARCRACSRGPSSCDADLHSAKITFQIAERGEKGE